jgi:hypothetical protein
MKSRCRRRKDKKYSQYGGAGVTVSDAWLDFEGFFDDLGERPAGTTLGRILDLGNYEKGNAFWMTKAEQTLAAMNKRALTNVQLGLI